VWKQLNSLFIINEEPKCFIKPIRHLREGGSISPYLFIFYVEALSNLLIFEAPNGHIIDRQIRLRATLVSHLLLVDDSLVVCKGNQEQVESVENISLLYEQALR